jgi:hypothetical protein
LTEGAMQARKRDPELLRNTWALKTEVEQRSESATRHAVQILKTAAHRQPSRAIRLLHLSDLHFDAKTPVPARLQWLLDDLRQEQGLGFKELDYLVVSGDFTDKGCPEGFKKAHAFLSGLTQAFALSAERCILVPGNHDVADLREAYDWRENERGLEAGSWVQQGAIILARNAAKYAERFKAFSDSLYHKFLQRPYPAVYAEQGLSIPFWETGIQFLTLNSCWEIDQFHRTRASIHPEAVAHVLGQAQKQVTEAREAGRLAPGAPLLRIAVWHHAVTAPDYKLKDREFLSNLQKNSVKLGLHGDVHEMRRECIGYEQPRQLHIVASGSFGARSLDLPEAVPRLYNVLEIARDLKTTRVHTRRQPKPDGAWDGWHEWPAAKKSDGRLPYYDIEL